MALPVESGRTFRRGRKLDPNDLRGHWPLPVSLSPCARTMAPHHRPKQHGHVIMDWNLWNHEPKEISFPSSQGDHLWGLLQ
jgi:hypothetical protein